MIWTLLIGLIVGFIAKLLTPGNDPGGCIATILLGVAGSFIGAIVGRAVGLYQPDQPAGFVMSVLGAIVLLLIYRAIKRPRA